LNSILLWENHYFFMLDPLEFATHLALHTGKLLGEYFNLAGVRATQKADHSVVTEADLAADSFITNAIRREFPQDNLISEESSHPQADPQSPTWIIDPLDGTTNFSLGLSIWGVSIARLLAGSPEIGVLYFPLVDELYRTRRGAGAFLNDTPIATHSLDPDQPMAFFACCSRTFRRYDISLPYKPRIMGSSAYTFCMLARGSALLGFDATPKIWDLAAAWLLVEESGGTIAAFEGSPPFPISSKVDYRQTIYPTLAASTPDIYKFGHSKIRRKPKSGSSV
jgi:myo-inositol-1(or 4)-monophosphatase